MLLLITSTFSLGNSLMNPEVRIGCHWLLISLLSAHEMINLSLALVMPTYASLLSSSKALPLLSSKRSFDEEIIPLPNQVETRTGIQVLWLHEES